MLVFGYFCLKVFPIFPVNLHCIMISSAIFQNHLLPHVESGTKTLELKSVSFILEGEFPGNVICVLAPQALFLNSFFCVLQKISSQTVACHHWILLHTPFYTFPLPHISASGHTIAEYTPAGLGFCYVLTSFLPVAIPLLDALLHTFS